MKTFDIAILGGGPGGYVAAIRAAQLGYNTVLFEGHKIGGVCLNYGCIPTKTLLKTAKVFKEMNHADEYGIDRNHSDFSINWQSMMQRKNKVVDRLTSGVEQLLRENKVTIIPHFAKAGKDNTLIAEDETYAYKYLIVATGSKVSYPNIPGLKESHEKGIVIDSTDAISLSEKPDSLVILGGGVIAVEFATFYSTIGVDVTLIQRSETILSNMDEEVRKTMTRHLKKSKVNVFTSTQIEKVDGHTVTFQHKGKQKEATGDFILASLGRKPNIQGLESLDLTMAKKGIKVDELLRTSKENVYAIGDVTGGFMLAHVASAEAIVAVESIHGQDNPINYQHIPSCIYTFPEVASVGLNESAAKDQGYTVQTGKFPILANGRALAENETTGFVKLVADEKTGKLLGMHIIATTATDMITEGTLALHKGASIQDINHTIHPHPTFSEMVLEAAHVLSGHPIHTL